jgi:hypothetical protein
MRGIHRRGAEEEEEEEERSAKSEIKIQSEVDLVSVRLCVLCASAVKGINCSAK